MVYAKLVYLAFIACLWQVSAAQSLRRVRPGCPAPRVVPRVPAPTPYPRNMNNLSARYRYECNLEQIISKLINALIYTVLHKDGSGASGGSIGGSGGGAGGGSGGGAGGGSGGGATGGKGSGSVGRGNNDMLNSLLDLEVLLGDYELANLAVLGDSSGAERSSLIDLELDGLGRELLRLGVLGGERGD